jgi:hypothetical protein
MDSLMRLPRLAATLSALLIVAAAPASADQILGPGRIVSGTNAVVLPGGPTLGLWSGGKYTATPDALRLKGSDSTGDVSGMSVKLDPTAALTSFSAYLPALPVPAAAFGAKGDGSDDAPAINKAVRFACSRGGGTVVLMPYHRIGAPIDNNCSGVLVRGIGSAGADSPHDAGGIAGTLVEPMAGYTGDALVHRTRTASERGVAPTSVAITTGGGFEGITVHGFTRNLHVTSTRRGTYRLNLLDATGQQSALFDTLPDYRQGAAAQMGEAGDTQGMTLDVFLRQTSDAASGTSGTGAADGIWFTACAGCGNPSYNFDMRFNAQVHNGWAWRVISADNNTWSNFRVGVTGTGKPFYIQASVAGTYTNDSNTFTHYFSNAAGYIEASSDRPNGAAAVQTVIYNLDIANSSVLPVASGDAKITILNSYPGWVDYTPVVRPEGGAFTGTTVAEARYQRIPFRNTMMLSATVSATFGSASGALIISLTVPPRGTVVLAGRDDSNNATMTCVGAPGDFSLKCLRYDGQSPLVSGHSYTVSGMYETP